MIKVTSVPGKYELLVVRAPCLSAEHTSIAVSYLTNSRLQCDIHILWSNYNSGIIASTLMVIRGGACVEYVAHN